MAQMEIICNRNVRGGCGFRAPDRYFETKKRFRAGICPGCSGPVLVVYRNTDTAVPGATVEEETGRINIPSEQE